MGRETSDEAYVLDIADAVLGLVGQRQHRFDFLRGDPSPRRPKGTWLPVDAFYESLNLVIEYREKQHTEPTPFFDERETVSGVRRSEQRRLYDERREVLLPLNGITCLVVAYDELAHNGRGRLLRDAALDEKSLRTKLSRWIDQQEE